MSILVVLTEESQAGPLVNWGYQFARAKRESLVVVFATDREGEGDCAEVGREASEGEIIDSAVKVMRAAAARAEAVAQAIDAEHPSPGVDHPMIALKRMYAAEPLHALEKEALDVQASLMVVQANWKIRGETLESRLFHHAVVDTVVLRCGGHDEGAEYTARSILVPAGRGGNVSPAVQLGARLATRNCGVMTAFYVETPNAIRPKEVAGLTLRHNLDQAGVKIGPHVEARVQLDTDLERGIRRIVEARKPDLLLVGAEDERFIKRLLLSTFPDSLFAGEDAVTLAIIRRAQPFRVQVARTIERWFFLKVPQATREDRIRLYERLRTGSEWGFDFMALIALSTTIAALGLIQSSAAVVIGAMLVAPLMTPILGAGLALVSGNAVFMRSAAKAIVLGFALAVSIGVVVGLLSPVKTLTPELISRGGPNLLDMGVAFVSGVAAAFAMSRSHLIAALPGVAIAAALVPPIATVGIAIAWGEFDVALGSALLFGTNVVAIIIGASVIMFAVGVRRRKSSWSPWLLGALVVVMIGLAVPLADYLWTAARQGARATVPDELRDEIKAQLAGPDTPRFVQAVRAPDVRNPDVTLLTVYVEGPGVTPALARSLAASARPLTKGALRVRVVPVIEVDAE